MASFPFTFCASPSSGIMLAFLLVLGSSASRDERKKACRTRLSVAFRALCSFSCGGVLVLEHGADLVTQLRRVLMAMHGLGVEHSGFHRGCDSETRMNAAEVVIGEMQSDSGFQMRQLFAESICQPRQPAKLHPHGEVLPFHVRRADMVGIGIARADFGYNLHDWAWGVPRISVRLAPLAEQLYDLSEVHIQAETFRNHARVVNQAICGQLHAIRKATVQVPQKFCRILPRALADAERRNQLGFRINRHKNPLISNFRGITAADSPRLLLYEGPNFINLQIPTMQFAHPLIHQTRGASASEDQQPHDGVAIQAREPFSGADRAAFNEALNRPDCCIGLRQHRVTGKFRVRFAECGIAGVAAPTLNPALTEKPESLADSVFAFPAGHGFSPLAFCGESRQDIFGSESWLTPRFGLAPTPAETEAGALNQQLINRWGARHRFLPAFLKCSALIQQGVSHLAPKSFRLRRHRQSHFPAIGRFVVFNGRIVYFALQSQTLQNSVDTGESIFRFLRITELLQS